MQEERTGLEESRYALLIDADNVSPKYIGTIMREAKTSAGFSGVISIRRIYGDWTEPEKASWKSCLLENSLNPIQQYSYTTGKNASDSAMIIDAMDILYTGNVDGFIIASSDSDFTKLAMRLREAGKRVIGMGERKTPSPFIKACDQFITLDLLLQETKANASSGKKNKKNSPSKTSGKKNAQEEASAEKVSPITTLREIRISIEMLLKQHSDEDGWMFLGDIGNMLTKLYPDFDCRNYGYSKLSELIKSLSVLEVRKDTQEDGHNQLVYVRKRAK